MNEFTFAIKVTNHKHGWTIEQVDISGDATLIMESKSPFQTNSCIADIGDRLITSGYFILNAVAVKDNVKLYEYKSIKPVFDYNNQGGL